MRIVSPQIVAFQLPFTRKFTSCQKSGAGMVVGSLTSQHACADFSRSLVRRLSCHDAHPRDVVACHSPRHVSTPQTENRMSTAACAFPAPVGWQLRGSDRRLARSNAVSGAAGGMTDVEGNGSRAEGLDGLSFDLSMETLRPANLRGLVAYLVRRLQVNHTRPPVFMRVDACLIKL